MTVPERDWDEQDQRPASAQTEPDTWARRLDPVEAASDPRVVALVLARDALALADSECEPIDPDLYRGDLHRSGVNASVTEDQARALLDAVAAWDAIGDARGYCTCEYPYDERTCGVWEHRSKRPRARLDAALDTIVGEQP